MTSNVAYYFALFAVILTHNTIVPVNGQCTTIDGCENGDSCINIEAQIQHLKVELFDHVSKLVQNAMRSQQSQNLWKPENGNSDCGPTSDVCDCSDIKERGHTENGVYEVCTGRNQSNRFCIKAFCEDMDNANGVSLVFQRHKDGGVNFYRTWAEYREGFGDLDGEFWLGNKMLYLLTSKRNYKLRIDLEDWEGKKRFAEYGRFYVCSSTTNYTLEVDGYSGNAGDSLKLHNGQQFSTKDVDNDQNNATSCAIEYRGAWWYSNCIESNLNGIYNRGNYSGSGTEGEGIIWHHWLGNRYSLKSTEMKLVPVA